MYDSFVGDNDMMKNRPIQGNKENCCVTLDQPAKRKISLQR